MGSRNLAFALVEHPTTVRRMGVIDLGKHAAREATDRLVDSMLDENAWMLEGDHEVVIELQPSSGICKTLSHVIQSMFRQYDTFQGQVPRPVRFMQAGNKLRFNNDLYLQLLPTTYAGRKNAAVAMARIVLAENESRFLQFFEAQGHKQRTDLADALVQGCRHLQERGPKE